MRLCRKTAWVHHSSPPPIRVSDTFPLCPLDLQNTLIRQNISRALGLFPRRQPRASCEKKPFFGMCNLSNLGLLRTLPCSLTVSAFCVSGFFHCNFTFMRFIHITIYGCKSFVLIVLAFCFMNISQFMTHYPANAYLVSFQYCLLWIMQLQTFQYSVFWWEHISISIGIIPMSRTVGSQCMHISSL